MHRLVMRAHESLLHQVEDRSGLLGSTAPVFRLTARIRWVPVHDHFRSTASRCSLARLPTCARTSELKAGVCFGRRANCAQLASVFRQAGANGLRCHCRRHNLKKGQLATSQLGPITPQLPSAQCLNLAMQTAAAGAARAAPRLALTRLPPKAPEGT